MERQSVSLRGGAVEASVLRGGRGPGLVFLSGAVALTPTDPFLAALAEEFEVTAPIHPGFEDLDDLDHVRDIHELAIFYDDLLGALGLDGVSILGHSFGGMVGAEIAAHFPSRVSRLVLVAPVGLWNDEYPVADLFAIPIHELQTKLWIDPNSPAAQSVAQSFTAAAGEAGNPLVEMYLGMVRAFASAGKFMWPIPDKGLSRRLHRISAPTLLIWGSEDQILPARYADDFLAGIGEAKAEFLDGAGHMVLYEKQDDVIKLTAQFVS